MKRAAIFARKSTADRPGQPNITAQLQACRSWAEAHEYEVVKEIIEEDISGALSYLERPGIVEMLHDARLGQFDAVIFHKVDRLQRDEREGMRIVLDAHDVGLDIFIEETGRKFAPLDGWEGMSDVARAKGAADERRRIKERLVRGRIQAMKEGRWMGGPVPFGYDLTEEKKLELQPDEAETVRLIFNLAAAPEASITTITKELAGRGVRNRLGRPFSKTHLGELLRDPIYAGKGRTVTMGGRNERGEDLGVPEETVTIPAPAIIDTETFDAVGRTLSRRRKRFYNPQQFHTYALAGRIVHLHEDGSIWGMGGERPPRGRLYRCQASRPGGPGCPGTSPDGTPANRRRTSVDASLVERYILELGLRMIDSPEVIQEMADDATRTRLAIQSTQVTREELERRLADLDEERRRALDQNRKGWLSDVETTEVMDDIARRRADLEAEIDGLGRRVSVDDIIDAISRFTVSPDALPSWWTYEPPRAGTLTPADPEWPSLVAGLRDEVSGESPDIDNTDLSEWAKSWARHLAETLNLTVVVNPDGEIRATTVDPRLGLPESRLSTIRD